MKNRILGCLFFSLTYALAFGSGGQDAPGGDAAVKLTMYHYHDLSDQTATGQWNEILAAWEEEHPEIAFDIEYQNNEAFHNKLQAMAVSGRIPDLLYLWPLKRTGYVTRSGLIKDLRPRLAGKTEGFAPAALTPQGLQGEIYELPQQVTATHVVYANRKILDRLGLSYPETLEEMIAQGQIIKDAGFIPIAMDNGDGWQMQSCLLSALTERGGGMDWYRDALTGKASFADPEFVNALSAVDRLAREEMFSPGVNQAGYGVALDDFINERAVYLIDGGWRVNTMVEELPEELKPYVDLYSFPDIPEQKGASQSTSVVAGTGFGMSAALEGAKADAAWEWIWFYSGPVGAGVRRNHGMIPSYRVDLAGADPLLDKLAAFLGSKPAGYVIDAVIDAEGMNVLHPDLQEMIFGNKTPRQVAENFEAWVAANDSTRNPR